MKQILSLKNNLDIYILIIICACFAQDTAVAQSNLEERLRRMEDEMREQRQLLKIKDQQIEELSRKINQVSGEPDRSATPATPITDQDELDRLVKSIEGPARSVDQRGVSYDVGDAKLRLIDISAIVDVVLGGSDARDEEIERLQGGAHDPKRRGLTLQQLELSFFGAVDPYFTGEAHVIITEDEIELEEAFATTSSLPRGLQLEAGYFFTEFGRINAQHPHFWDWLDQPIINSRLFGGEGMRGTGARLGWLTPLPWFSVVHFGAQNASGDLMASFNGEGLGGHGHGGGEEEEEELFEEGIGGRPILEENNEVRNLKDLVYLARWVNGVELSDNLSAQFGVSSLFGPNNSGSNADTWIYGGDLVVKWDPEGNTAKRSKLVWQTEIMKREFDADRFTLFDDMGNMDPSDDIDIDLPGETLEDWGLYTQLLFRLNRNWAIGARYEYVTGNGQSAKEGELIKRDEDFFRNDRYRISPLLLYQPSEFTRLRLQYNYDDFDKNELVSSEDAHSLWFGLEVLWGKHPAHSY